jgi:hypothetical protein
MSITLTFFCEMEAKALRSMFDEFPVMDDVKALGANVSLGIPDFSAERADVVRPGLGSTLSRIITRWKA